MLNSFRECDGALEWSARTETLRLEPWGGDAIRVRATLGPILDGLPGALLEPPDAVGAVVKIEDGTASLTNGALTAGVSVDAQTGQAVIRFADTATGAELLAEEPIHFWWPGPRLYTPTGNGCHRLEQHFRAYEGERLHGLGQHTHGMLDQ